jgi:hypothetical protein
MTDLVMELLSVLNEIRPSLVALAALSLMSFGLGLVAALLINFTKLSTIAAWRNIAVMSLLMLGVGVLGAAAGLAGGQSRTGVVGEIIPAAFVLLGGVSAYLFGVTPQRAPVVALTTIGFAVTLFSGFHSGSWQRTFAEEQSALRAVCLKAMTDAAFVKEPGALDAFLAAMVVRQLAAAEPPKGETAQGPQQFFERKARLCATAVRGWTLPEQAYEWSAPQLVADERAAQAAPVIPSMATIPPRLAPPRPIVTLSRNQRIP